MEGVFVIPPYPKEVLDYLRAKEIQLLCNLTSEVLEEKRQMEERFERLSCQAEEENRRRRWW